MYFRFAKNCLWYKRPEGQSKSIDFSDCGSKTQEINNLESNVSQTNEHKTYDQSIQNHRGDPMDDGSLTKSICSAHSQTTRFLHKDHLLEFEQRVHGSSKGKFHHIERAQPWVSAQQAERQW